MKLLTELTDEYDFEIIEEGVGAEKTYTIEGVFLQSEIKNRNGRIYPKETMQKEVNRYIKEYVNTNRALGELGHPTNPSINLDRVSHKIISLKENGNDYIGRAKILDTPYGKIVKGLMSEGVRLGVSSRGLGTIKKQDNANIVGEDFCLVTAADIVSDPSAPDAFVSNLMENKEWVWQNGSLVETLEQAQETVNNLSKQKKLNEEALIKIFNSVLNGI